MAQSTDALTDFKPGSLRGTPGYFRVGQTHGGQWWLIDPEDRPFFARAVHGVRAEPAAMHDPAARLRAWGFNALGCGSDRLYLEEGLAFMPAVDFCRGEGLMPLAGARVPDVFEPGWPERAQARAAAVCAPLAGTREVLGWFTDEFPAWARPAAADRPGLLQSCLSLEPAHAAYHAAWEFVLALHGGRWEALTKAWGEALTNKEALRERTRLEQGLAGRGYLRDDAQWVEEYARRYFSVATAAVRTQAPHHLVLGCRWGGPATAAMRAGNLNPTVDVRVIDHTELAAQPAAAARPVLLADFNWTRPEFVHEAAARPLRRLTAVERMLRRGRLVLSRAVAHPAVIGYAWSHWADRPGEQPPFASGLVHTHDCEAREHTELLTAINEQVEELRSMAAVTNEEPA
jgi:hypothetical protein